VACGRWPSNEIVLSTNKLQQDAADIQIDGLAIRRIQIVSTWSSCPWCRPSMLRNMLFNLWKTGFPYLHYDAPNVFHRISNAFFQSTIEVALLCRFHLPFRAPISPKLLRSLRRDHLFNYNSRDRDSRSSPFRSQTSGHHIPAPYRHPQFVTALCGHLPNDGFTA